MDGDIRAGKECNNEALFLEATGTGRCKPTAAVVLRCLLKSSGANHYYYAIHPVPIKLAKAGNGSLSRTAKRQCKMVQKQSFGHRWRKRFHLQGNVFRGRLQQHQHHPSASLSCSSSSSRWMFVLKRFLKRRQTIMSNHGGAQQSEW